MSLITLPSMCRWSSSTDVNEHPDEHVQMKLWGSYLPPARDMPLLRHRSSSSS